MVDIVKVDALRDAIEDALGVKVNEDQSLAIYSRAVEIVSATVAATVLDDPGNAERYVEAQVQGLITEADQQDIDATLARRRKGV